MANGDTLPTRPGQVNLAGDARALFYKKFSGEVLATFAELNNIAPMLRQRSIASGKSAGFQVLGRAAAFFHTPGLNILDGANNKLSQIAGAERVIFIDSKLMSAATVDDLEALMSEWEVRGPVAEELARAMAKLSDRLAIHTLVLAARASATITGLNGGSVVSDVDMQDSGVALMNALFAAAQVMDEKDVPDKARYAVIDPQMHYNLIRDPAVSIAATSPTVTQATVGYPLINSELSPGNGNFARAQLYRAADFVLIKSNHIPHTNILSNDATFGTGSGGASAQGNVYYGDFTDTVGVCFQEQAAGRLMLREMSTEAEWHQEVQAWLLDGKIAQGMGILRPECAVELSKAGP